MPAGLDDIVVGVDLGGTKVQVALVRADGHVLASERRATGADRGPDAVIATIADAVNDMVRDRRGHRVAGIGVGVAGQVDPEEGIVRFAPNLKWRDVPLRDRLSLATSLPVRVLNDVQAATYGEWAFGAGRGVRDLVCLFVGTGVGGGAVVAGRLASGAAGRASSATRRSRSAAAAAAAATTAASRRTRAAGRSASARSARRWAATSAR